MQWSKVGEYIYNPYKIVNYLGNRGKLNFLSDELFLELKYRACFNKKLDLKNPTTFNEKLQWLKLYDRRPEYTQLVDKYAVRRYIAETIGEDYLIPLLGVWDRFEDVDFNQLPEQFVLKSTHDSGGVLICRDKSAWNIDEARKIINKCLKRNYYYYGREWPYKNVPHKVIAEKFMTDSSNGLIDYKFFCFNGFVDCVMICIERHLNNPQFYFFNEEWELLRLNKRGMAVPQDFTLPKPQCIDMMFNLARKLSKGIPYLRVDFYECDEKIYFGELTFYPDSGFDINITDQANERWGKLIDIGERKI
ncbi:ATP-grasp fold amidoligase family protein [Dehalobacter sp. TeCB1]|uniref:ATP-grasp fold amidoligase family protein n=1 Tax=Dehalobacter sp. TeCB1 TaxID=1843715 RepID=UPI00083A41DF|nr:ATP-grasp fold amidoligase family protein [Dehalobacter sp. TeCB1]OCZ49437.1 hypothetical protein A7D23_02995 [Dehalobacter sp. TeCB1]